MNFGIKFPGGESQLLIFYDLYCILIGMQRRFTPSIVCESVISLWAELEMGGLICGKRFKVLVLAV